MEPMYIVQWMPLLKMISFNANNSLYCDVLYLNILKRDEVVIYLLLCFYLFIYRYWLPDDEAVLGPESQES